MGNLIDSIFLVREIKSKEGVLHFKRWSPFTKYLAPFFDKHLFNVYIHQINKADQDKDMHDHPWDFVSIILKGGYIEQLSSGTIDRKQFSVSFKKADEFHKVVELYGKTYSLVITTKRYRDWGYNTSTGWVENK